MDFIGCIGSDSATVLVLSALLLAGAHRDSVMRRKDITVEVFALEETFESLTCDQRNSMTQPEL